MEKLLKEVCVCVYECKSKSEHELVNVYASSISGN